MLGPTQILTNFKKRPEYRAPVITFHPTRDVGYKYSIVELSESTNNTTVVGWEITVGPILVYPIFT